MGSITILTSIGIWYNVACVMVTISPKFQVVIPKEVREALNFEPGMKVSVIAKGEIVYIVPQRPLSRLKGIAKGLKGNSLRDKKDRWL